MLESLKIKATKGVMWSAIERFSVQGVQFLLTIIIARLVSPSDYGLIAMLGIFLAIAQTLTDSGFSFALIHKQDRTETDFSTAFYFNILIGAFVYILLFFLSSHIASFYDTPQLELVTKIIGMNVIIASLGIIQKAKLTILLNFKLQASISLSAVLISGGAGVYMAYNEYGVWALVYQSLLNNIIGVLLLWILTRWSPVLCFSYGSLKELFCFGYKLLVANLIATIYTNIYSLVIGKKFSSSDLGYYNRAYSLAYFIPGNLTEIITRVAYPLQCKIKDENEMLRNSLLIFIRLSAYVVFPIMTILCVLAYPIVDLILSPKWLPLVPLMRILCIAYMWDTIMRLNAYVLSIKGRTDLTLKSEIIKKGFAVMMLIITIPLGLKMICWGILVYSLIDLFVITRFTRRVLNVHLKDELRELYPSFLLASSMGVIVFLVSNLFVSSFLQILLSTLLGVIYYIIISCIFKIREWTILCGILKYEVLLRSLKW